MGGGERRIRQGSRTRKVCVSILEGGSASKDKCSGTFQHFDVRGPKH